MSVSRSSGVKRTLGVGTRLRRPWVTVVPSPSPRSYVVPYQSRPASTARHRLCGIRWAWMSMLRIGRGPFCLDTFLTSLLDVGHLLPGRCRSYPRFGPQRRPS